jgi:hypothetical protein
MLEALKRKEIGSVGGSLKPLVMYVNIEHPLFLCALFD